MPKCKKMTVQTSPSVSPTPFCATLFSARGLARFPDGGLLMTLAWMHRKSPAIRSAARWRFRAHRAALPRSGRRDSLPCPVEKILVEDDKAVGVRLADGTEHRSDVAISAADGHATIFDMLEGKYINDKIRGYYDDLPIFPPMIQVSLGVARSFARTAGRP